MNTGAELWMPIPGYEGIYEASDRGRVRSFWSTNPRYDSVEPKPQSITAGRSGTGGYMVITLRRRCGAFAQIAVHRLVLLAFVGEPPSGHNVHHINRARDDNRLANLEYCPVSENCGHAAHPKRGPTQRARLHADSMTGAQLKAQYRAMGLTAVGAAGILLCAPRTINDYCTSKNRGNCIPEGKRRLWVAYLEENTTNR